MALSALPESQDILRYVKALRPYETVLQEKLRKESIAMGADKLCVDPDQAAVLAVLIGLMEAKSVLELETSTGYNALRMAQTLSETGRLMTCACMEKWAGLAKRYWRKAKVEQRIKCCTGPVGVAMAVYESHVGQGALDMVFIGASLVDSDAYYESSLALLRPGGLVVMAGTSPARGTSDAKGKSRTQAIAALNVNVRHDPRVETMSMQIGGGMLVARKK